MTSGAGWDVTRTGRTVRINLNAGSDVSEDLQVPKMGQASLLSCSLAPC